MRSFVVLVVCLLAHSAEAFCGFYVSSAGGNLFNDATMVSLMRDGTRTALAMQNTYRGPPEDFALVIPVPVILQKENVKTLPKAVFERLDALASPRLVEMYTDPALCGFGTGMALGMAGMGVGGGGRTADLGVKVEAKFEVGEYQIVILSAKDALGLDIWLKEEKYKMPPNAAPLLAPYVQNGWKFFVAKVNTKKVKFVAGQAVLSPLRFHYDSEKFELPVRLGLINSNGPQDLIVHVIAKGRYEVANRPNLPIATNLDVKLSVQPVFGAFYSELVDRTFKKTPTAAITEFAWQGALPPPETMVQQGIYGVTCDPCPPPHPMDDPMARSLGADVMPGVKTDAQVAKFAKEATLTRLHLRYTKDSLTDDLVFKQVDPLHGGVPGVAKTEAAKVNRFQGRYIMWRKGSACDGLGLGMNNGIVSSGLAGTNAVMSAKTKLDGPFEALLVTDVPELDLVAKGKPDAGM
ncbi:MAG TPA: DUF2330 domain-containing protein [Archangium sp.]